MCGASGGTEQMAGLKYSVCVHRSHCGPAMLFILHGILSQASSQHRVGSKRKQAETTSPVDFLFQKFFPTPQHMFTALFPDPRVLSQTPGASATRNLLLCGANSWSTQCCGKNKAVQSANLSSSSGSVFSNLCSSASPSTSLSHTSITCSIGPYDVNFRTGISTKRTKSTL